MKTKIKFIGMALFFILVSCAVITVNIYFPEKDVKEAYKTLEKELMGTGEGQEETKPEGKPESFFRFELVQTAYAQDDRAEKVAEIIKKMPDVVDAYKEMGERLPDIDKLRDSGKVGEANTGLLAALEGQLTAEEKKLMEMENENRKTVMRGMAKAIIRINRDRENEETLKKAMPLAIEQFAAVRQDSAKKGWWIQDTAGNWMKK